jgi:hypothetical protein
MAELLEAGRGPAGLHDRCLELGKGLAELPHLSAKLCPLPIRRQIGVL